MNEPYRTRRRVEFRDTDASGLIHFSAFFVLMEAVEHELLRHLGTSVHLTTDQGTISWPRVAAKCEYHSPVHFEDELEITATISRVGEKSVTYHYEFAHDGRAVATGEITAVCCRIESGRPPQSIPIPPDLAARLRS